MLKLRKHKMLMKIMKKAIWDLPTPSKFSAWWNYGSLIGLCLIMQLITGMFLAMHYTPDINLAFMSMSHICRDVKYGWLMRKIHANGGSMFFICLYMHMGRSLYYGSYMKIMTWKMGIMLFMISMLTAFFGYVLPWGQMSFWAATVITNLVTAIPYMGTNMVQWMWGGYSVDNPTLQRFFVFHFIAPFILIMISVIHLMFLHKSGSKNPLGMSSNFDNMPFHPFFTSKDMMGFIMFFFIFSILTLLNPTLLSDPENFILAKPLVTPPHIQPEWYFLFVYAILRSIPNKLGGVMALMGAMLILFLIPLLHFSMQKSNHYRPMSQILFWFIVGNFMILTWMGSSPVEPPFIMLGQTASIIYFMKFLILFPMVSYFEKKTQNFIS